MFYIALLTYRGCVVTLHEKLHPYEHIVWRRGVLHNTKKYNPPYTGNVFFQMSSDNLIAMKGAALTKRFVTLICLDYSNVTSASHSGEHCPTFFQWAGNLFVTAASTDHFIEVPSESGYQNPPKRRPFFTLHFPPHYVLENANVNHCAPMCWIFHQSAGTKCFVVTQPARQ